jgi:hypothetical protein
MIHSIVAPVFFIHVSHELIMLFFVPLLLSFRSSGTNYYFRSGGTAAELAVALVHLHPEQPLDVNALASVSSLHCQLEVHNCSHPRPYHYNLPCLVVYHRPHCPQKWQRTQTC